MAVKCEVLLFAQLRETVGHARLFIELRDGAKVADAIASLAAQHRAISEQRDRLAVAVNERYVHPDHPLTDGDVIALIPPVSGG